VRQPRSEAALQGAHRFQAVLLHLVSLVHATASQALRRDPNLNNLTRHSSKQPAPPVVGPRCPRASPPLSAGPEASYAILRRGWSVRPAPQPRGDVRVEWPGGTGHMIAAAQVIAGHMVAAAQRSAGHMVAAVQRGAARMVAAVQGHAGGRRAHGRSEAGQRMAQRCPRCSSGAWWSTVVPQCTAAWRCQCLHDLTRAASPLRCPSLRTRCRQRCSAA
jgi:hypothetical protein